MMLLPSTCCPPAENRISLANPAQSLTSLGRRPGMQAKPVDDGDGGFDHARADQGDSGGTDSRSPS